MLEAIVPTIILAIWLMLPAYIANPSAALFGGGKPIDGGRKFSDGKRILGDGKTYRGFFTGVACGMIVGAIQILLAPYIAPHLAGIVNPDQLMTWTAMAAITMPIGALLGDIVKSFFKRRIGFDRGAMLPVADQLDFVAGAWLLTYPDRPVVADHELHPRSYHYRAHYHACSTCSDQRGRVQARQERRALVTFVQYQGWAS